MTTPIDKVQGVKQKKQEESTNSGFSQVPNFMQPGFIGNILNGSMGQPQSTGATPSTSASAL